MRGREGANGGKSNEDETKNITDLQAVVTSQTGGSGGACGNC